MGGRGREGKGRKVGGIKTACKTAPPPRQFCKLQGMLQGAPWHCVRGCATSSTRQEVVRRVVYGKGRVNGTTHTTQRVTQRLHSLHISTGV